MKEDDVAGHIYVQNPVGYGYTCRVKRYGAPIPCGYPKALHIEAHDFVFGPRYVPTSTGEKVDPLCEHCGRVFGTPWGFEPVHHEYASWGNDPEGACVTSGMKSVQDALDESISEADDQDLTHISIARVEMPDPVTYFAHAFNVNDLAERMNEIAADGDGGEWAGDFMMNVPDGHGADLEYALQEAFLKWANALPPQTPLGMRWFEQCWELVVMERECTWDHDKPLEERVTYGPWRVVKNRENLDLNWP